MKKEMQVLQLRLSNGVEFDTAQVSASKAAAKYVTVPMLLSWLNRKTGQHSPNVDCCREEGKASWEIYAESRGGALRVQVDDDYVFIFGEGLVTS